jgi:hypothetical protein
MKSYKDFILQRFPFDDKLGFYVKPHLPASVLGKALNLFDGIKNPSDVIAVYLYDKLLGAGGVALTETTAHYSKAMFVLEDVRSGMAEDRTVHVDVNRGGALSRHSIRVEKPEAGATLARFFGTLADVPKADAIALPAGDYSSYSPEAKLWLELRDEILKTIDLLHERFNAGKISFLEYEDKKADLLRRL